MKKDYVFEEAAPLKMESRRDRLQGHVINKIERNLSAHSRFLHYQSDSRDKEHRLEPVRNLVANNPERNNKIA